MAKISRFQKRDSDRSGFTYKRMILTEDEGLLVGPDEFDNPPPSSKPLGSEGEINQGDARSGYDSYAIESEKDYTIQYVTATEGITFQRESYTSGETMPFGFLHVVGSNQTVSITKNPQISKGQQNDQVTVMCIGSAITLLNGSGLSLSSSILTMESGDIVTFFYSETDSTWHETSRGDSF